MSRLSASDTAQSASPDKAPHAEAGETLGWLKLDVSVGHSFSASAVRELTRTDDYFVVHGSGLVVSSAQGSDVISVEGYGLCVEHGAGGRSTVMLHQQRLEAVTIGLHPDVLEIRVRLPTLSPPLVVLPPDFHTEFLVLLGEQLSGIGTQSIRCRFLFPRQTLWTGCTSTFRAPANWSLRA